MHNISYIEFPDDGEATPFQPKFLPFFPVKREVRGEKGQFHVNILSPFFFFLYSFHFSFVSTQTFRSELGLT